MIRPPLIQKRINDPRAQFLVGDASDFDFSATQSDVSVSGLLLNFVASPQQVVHNTVRLIKPHGWVAAYVWDYADKMEIMRYFWDAVLALDPAAIKLDPGKLFTICHPDHLKALFKDAGLQAVEVTPIDILGVFQDLDDYWQPFVAAQGSVSKYLRSLNPEKRQALYAQLQAQLPFEADGTIHLTMRAWAVKGLVVAP